MGQRPLKMLVIDDDFYFRQKICGLLKDFGMLWQAQDLESATRLLGRQQYDLVVIDMNLKEENPNEGLDILSLAKLQNLYSVILTDNESNQLVRQAYELGCQHYLSKDQGVSVIELIAKERAENLKADPFIKFFMEDFLTQDQDLKNEIKSLRNPFMLESPILILGETGVGKGTVAKFIHKICGGKEENFVSLNVSAIPENLIEAEFFGHTKGAFTGAGESKLGKLKQADGGTLFLDELGSMPMSMQKKLLKALEEKSFYPLGSSRPVTSRFRLVSATCEDLWQKVADGSFRLDLFHRINGLPLTIPPLRERKADIEILIRHYLKGWPRKIFLHEGVMEKLVSFVWKGNVRELKSNVENLLTKSRGIVEVKDLPAHILSNQDSAPMSSSFLNGERLAHIKKHGMKSFLHRVEQEILKEVHEFCEGKPTLMKDLLKLSNSKFYRLINKGK